MKEFDLTEFDLRGFDLKEFDLKEFDIKKLNSKELAVKGFDFCIIIGKRTRLHSAAPPLVDRGIEDFDASFLSSLIG